MKKFYNIFLKLIHNLFLRIPYSYYKVFLPKAQWKSFVCGSFEFFRYKLEKFYVRKLWIRQL